MLNQFNCKHMIYTYLQLAGCWVRVEQLRVVYSPPLPGAPGYGQQQQAAPGYGQSGYQYPTGGVEYPKPRSRDPKPPGTGKPYEDY